MNRRPAVLVLAVLLAASSVVTPSSQSQEPRFRGGANLVRLDVYASVNGVAVTDLTAADFEVFEDNAPQQVSSFEFVRARGTVPDTARVEPNTVRESRARAAQADARLFVLFLDTLHVQIDGSYRATNPVATLLDRVVGEDDLVGVMTPEMSARNMAFSPRTSSVGRLLASNWTWGERGRLTPSDPREQELEQCYPDNGATAGISKALIERRREGKTLHAIEDLVQHLEGLREERSFVLLLSEGWTTPSPDAALARPIRLSNGGQLIPGGPVPIGATPDGRLTSGGDPNDRGFQSCERDRSLLANEDLDMEFRLLMQRANRANVSFYPIDPRGLVVFDDPIGPARPASPVADMNRMSNRQGALRRLAQETDGEVVLNTNIDKGLPRLLNDVGSYYLLGYVTTNQKLDGKYRRLTVRVKRAGVEVRARPGYLAPTAADLTSSTMPAKSQASAGVEQALSRLPGGRSATPLYLTATGGAGFLQMTMEVDRATAATPEWSKGASLRVEIGSADGTAASPPTTETLTLEPGKRVYALRHPARDVLPAGRYQIRVQAVPEGSRVPLTASTVATVPVGTALLGSASLASRRGTATGRLFEPTADPRFRRTERLNVETPILAADATLTARLLNRSACRWRCPSRSARRSTRASSCGRPSRSSCLRRWRRANTSWNSRPRAARPQRPSATRFASCPEGRDRDQGGPAILPLIDLALGGSCQDDPQRQEEARAEQVPSGVLAVQERQRVTHGLQCWQEVIPLLIRSHEHREENARERASSDEARAEQACQRSDPTRPSDPSCAPPTSARVRR